VRRRLTTATICLLLHVCASVASAQILTGAIKPNTKPVSVIPKAATQSLPSQRTYSWPKTVGTRPTVGHPKVINVAPERQPPALPQTANNLAAVPARAGAAAGEVQFGPRGEPLLWRVKSATATVYLLGSVHIGDKRIFPLDPRVDDAFHASDTVAFETEITPIAKAEIQRLLDLYGTYPAGQSLDQHLEPGLIGKLDALLERHHLARGRMHRLRPWCAALALSTIAYREAGFSPDYGIEEHLRRQATRKKVDHIETIAQQTDVFRLMPEAAQVDALRTTIEQFGELAPELGRALDAWRAGDLQRLATAILDPLRKTSPEFYASLVTARNKTMAAAVEQYLQNQGTMFVVVGSGHLIGAGSVLELLAERGHPAERI